MLGYGVGFSAASAVPVLGQSGIFNFAGGMAGGIAGEWLAMKIAKGLAGTKLGTIDDPIMGPKDIEKGLPARKLVRDPDGLMDHMLKGVGGGEPIVKDNVEGGKTKEKIDKTFKMKGKTYDLSKLQGGLSRKEFDALDPSDRERILKRMRMYQSQNYEQTHANIKGNANNIVSTNGVSNKVNNISNYDREEETVVVKSGSETGGDVVPETESKESLTPVVVGGGGDSEVSDALYKGG